MSNLLVKKLTPTARIPTRAHADDAGLDIYADQPFTIRPGETVAVPTGIALTVPRYLVGSVRPKSGLALKYGLTVLNAPGTIDRGYTGEVQVLLHNTSDTTYNGLPGQKIAQLVCEVIELPAVVEVNHLDPSERGDGGFGSTGLG